MDDVRRFSVYLSRMPTEEERLALAFGLLGGEYEIDSVCLYEKWGNTGVYAISFLVRISSREQFMVWLRWRLWYLEGRGVGRGLIVHPQ